MMRYYYTTTFSILTCMLLSFTGKAQYWNTKGNAGMQANNFFIGTVDKNPLSLRTNNTERLYLDAQGRAYSNSFWGFGMEPDQNYRLTIDGKIFSGGGLVTSKVNATGITSTSIITNDIITATINAPNNKPLELKTNGSTVLSFDITGNLKGKNIYVNAINTYHGSINAISKDLVFKTDEKERMRIYNNGQGVTITDQLAIGDQPQQGYKLYVNGDAYTKNGLAENVKISNNLEVKNYLDVKADNKNSVLKAVSNGIITMRGTVGVNMDPDEKYTLALKGNSLLKGVVKIGDVPESKAKDYVLVVGGKAICEEVKVQVKSMWPDYVFDKSYNLLSLEEVEKYIQQHKHLPGIPSASAIKDQNGIELGNMQSLLMQKVEELTLYLIELKKENELLKKDNTLLKEKIGIQ